MKPTGQTGSEAAIREAAAHWIVRRDRGLSANESIEFELWLAADQRHVVALQRAGVAWSSLDRLPESVAIPVLLGATRRRKFWRRMAVWGSLSAAAAALVIGGMMAWRMPERFSQPTVPSHMVSADYPRQITLSDGTVVQLNAGSMVQERFTASGRHVDLVCGEAHFAVTKNPAWPFIVHAGALQVRAVGTAFNVDMQASQIEVLVTEGRVQLGTDTVILPEAPGDASVVPALPLVEAGQRAVVPGRFVSGTPVVTVSPIDGEEMSRELAWQAPLLRLGGATLAELVLEFQRRSGQRVVLADPALAQLRVGGRFRADDAAGFASLMAATLDLEVENATDGTLVLRKKKPESR